MWRLLLLLPLVAACGDTTAPDPEPESPPTLASTLPSTLPSTYSFDLTSTCGERALIGDYRVWVEDDDVVEVRPRADVALVPTLADLEEMVADAEPDAVVETERDADGRLTWVSIDHRPDAIDDEECYRVTNVE